MPCSFQFWYETTTLQSFYKFYWFYLEKQSWWKTNTSSKPGRLLSHNCHRHHHSLLTLPKLCSAQLTLEQEASFMAPSVLSFTKEKNKSKPWVFLGKCMPDSGAVCCQLISCHLLLKSQLGRPAGAGFSCWFCQMQNIVCSCWTCYLKHLMSLSEYIFFLLLLLVLSRWFIS